MNNLKLLIYLFYSTIVFSQANVNYSYEMQYGDGKQVLGQSSSNPQKVPYSYLQNILDINVHMGDNIYVFTQIEYSNPPIYGQNRTSLDSMLTSFYIEYSNENLNIKVGDFDANNAVDAKSSAKPFAALEIKLAEAGATITRSFSFANLI